MTPVRSSKYRRMKQKYSTGIEGMCLPLYYYTSVLHMQQKTQVLKPLFPKLMEKGKVMVSFLSRVYMVQWENAIVMNSFGLRFYFCIVQLVCSQFLG